MFVLKVIKKPEEPGYFLRLRVVLYIKELALYMLYAWLSKYTFEFSDTDMAVVGGS